MTGSVDGFQPQDSHFELEQGHGKRWMSFKQVHFIAQFILISVLLVFGLVNVIMYPDTNAEGWMCIVI